MIVIMIMITSQKTILSLTVRKYRKSFRSYFSY